MKSNSKNIKNENVFLILFFFQVPSNTTTSLLRSASRHTNTITTSNQVQLQNMQQQQHPQQMGQPGQNKTYVRLSVKRPPEKKAFSCYQTLMDVHPSNRAESGKFFFVKL